MTTEIAVINRLGVALAADSAVTIPGYDGDKVFPTGDKLFELSENDPVALMVNGSMDFLGVPWEIIAKDFRRNCPEKAGALSIKEWVQSFLNFLSTHRTVNDDAVRRWQEGLFWELMDDLDQVARDQLAAAATTSGVGPTVPNSLQLIYVSIIEDQLKALANASVLESLVELDEQEVAAGARPLIDEQADQLPFEASEQMLALLTRLLTMRLLRDPGRLTATGLIVCGFGGDDLFPSLCAVEIDGHVAGKLRYQHSQSVEIERGKDTGTAISFAQTDVIDRLLRGTDSRYVDRTADFITENVSTILGSIFGRLGLRLVDKTGGEVAAEEIGKTVGGLIASRFKDVFVQNLSREFERKFKETIALMPKQDLIELAEALVSITAIERKASDDAGTVGGPIDVALITRSEGFVWIKRKQHFDPKLNPRYMWRRFGAHSGREQPRG